MSKRIINRPNQVVETLTQKTPQMFIEAYNQLCNEFGLNLTATPTWKLRDDGTFSLVILWNVGVLSKPEA